MARSPMGRDAEKHRPIRPQGACILANLGSPFRPGPRTPASSPHTAPNAELIVNLRAAHGLFRPALNSSRILGGPPGSRAPWSWLLARTKYRETVTDTPTAYLQHTHALQQTTTCAQHMHTYTSLDVSGGCAPKHAPRTERSPTSPEGTSAPLQYGWSRIWIKLCFPDTEFVLEGILGALIGVAELRHICSGLQEWHQCQHRSERRHLEMRWPTPNPRPHVFERLFERPLDTPHRS